MFHSTLTKLHFPLGRNLVFDLKNLCCLTYFDPIIWVWLSINLIMGTLAFPCISLYILNTYLGRIFYFILAINGSKYSCLAFPCLSFHRILF